MVNGAGPPIGPIAEVIVATDQLDADRAFCERVLGWRSSVETPVPGVVADRWLAPACAGARSFALRPPAGAPGAGIRLVEASVPFGIVPLTTTGWAAIEVLVADVDEVAAAVDAAGVDVLGRPAAVGDEGGGLRAMQIVLPGGAPVYLTEIRGSPPGFELPRIASGIGGVFIVVVATPDLEETRQFLETTFSLRRVTDHPLSVGVLNRAFGLPPETRHRVSSLQLAGSAAIEIDHYPSAALPRPMTSVDLPVGIAVVELHAADESPNELGPIEGPFGLRLVVVAP